MSQDMGELPASLREFFEREFFEKNKPTFDREELDRLYRDLNASLKLPQRGSPKRLNRFQILKEN